MSVPTSIEKLLKKHNVTYSLASLSPMLDKKSNYNIKHIPNPQQGARAHLLRGTSQEKLLAITPHQTVLDLQAIEDFMGERYTLVVGKQLKQVASNLGLEAMAALPMLGDIPTIVDRELLNQESLLLEIGVGDQLIELDGQSFQKLLSSTQVIAISTPLKALNAKVPQELDEECITRSVSLFTELRIKQRLEETLELPPLPTIAQRIIKLRVDPNADVNDLCEVIELDPSLAAQVVSWASSPYYSAPGTIKSVHDAIIRVLGFDMVLSLALGLSLGNTLKLPEQNSEGHLPYWQQAVYVATCTEALISTMPRECRPTYGLSYLSGLLHNLGYLIISEVFSEKFKAISDMMAANSHASPQAIEKHLIGVTRDQLGSWLMGSWNMPAEVCDALRYQSEPEFNGEHADYAKVVFLAKKLLNEHGLKIGISDDPIPDELFKHFKIYKSEALEAIDVMFEASDVLENMAKQMQA